MFGAARCVSYLIGKCSFHMMEKVRRHKLAAGGRTGSGSLT